MFKLIIALPLIVFAYAPTAGPLQAKPSALNEPERMTIRKTLGVPDATQITVAASKQLPAAPTLKVFQGARSNAKGDEEFAKWVEKWNRENGDRFGRLEIVSDISAAEVVVLYGLYSSSTLYLPSRLPTDREVANQLATGLVRSYVFVRKPDALEIVSRKTAMLVNGAGSSWDDRYESWVKEQHKHFEKLMRERSKGSNK
jgi:hypothetical protein